MNEYLCIKDANCFLIYSEIVCFAYQFSTLQYCYKPPTFDGSTKLKKVFVFIVFPTF